MSMAPGRRSLHSIRLASEEMPGNYYGGLFDHDI